MHQSHRAILRVGAQATLSRNFQLSFLQPLLGRRDVEIVLRSGAPADLLRALSTHLLDVVLTNQPPTGDGERTAEFAASMRLVTGN